jgi:hypothetical protein
MQDPQGRSTYLERGIVVDNENLVTKALKELDAMDGVKRQLA